MKKEDCYSVIDQLAELKSELETIVFPMFYDEPTFHPAFKQIMKYQLKKELIFDDWWFSTNGYGLSRMSDEDWRELAEAGFDYIRLTFHGVGDAHDKLVGRKGAYEDLVSTIQKAEEHNINWLAGMMLNSRNQSMYEETRDTVTGLGTPCTDFGWMLPQSQGRVLHGNSRVKVHRISRLLSGKSGWVTEAEFTERVLSNPDLGQKQARDNNCGIIYFDVDEELNVFYGGGCDGDPFNSIKSKVYLGNLRKTDIRSCYEKYLNHPPEPVKLLDKVTWAELAERYGSSDNEHVFHYTDIVGLIWSEKYLREFYSRK